MNREDGRTGGRKGDSPKGYGIKKNKRRKESPARVSASGPLPCRRQGLHWRRLSMRSTGSRVPTRGGQPARRARWPHRRRTCVRRGCGHRSPTKRMVRSRRRFLERWGKCLGRFSTRPRSAKRRSGMTGAGGKRYQRSASPGASRAATAWPIAGCRRHPCGRSSRFHSCRL